MKSIIPVIVLVLVSVITTGCSSTGDKGGSTMDTAYPSEQSSATSTSGYGDGSSISGTQTHGLSPDGSSMSSNAELNNPQSPLHIRTIYFMYDSSQIQDEFIAVIDAHARYLIANPNSRMTIEGHADERGSREYNIALGEQRAKAVARMMQVQGVNSNQLEIVSFGEEKPASVGYDDAAFQLNRRVELVYQGL
jgi:peptidoglycan-associated lipoprotein